MRELKLVFLLYFTNILLVTEASDGAIYKCKPNISDITTHVPILNLKDYCERFNRSCVPKCCKLDEILYTKTIINGNDTKEDTVCVSSSDLGVNDANFKELVIYDKSIEQSIRETEKNLDDIKWVHNVMFQKKSCGSLWDVSDPYLLEDGKFASDLSELGQGWMKWEPEYFCMDLNVADGDNETRLNFYVADELSHGNMETKQLFIGIATLISSAFLVLVFLVYCILPKLRNLFGMLFMAYVASQCLTYLLHGVLALFASHLKAAVLNMLMKMFYFFCLSVFFWLNIMSIDIWLTFRQQKFKKVNSSRKELVKFGWYSLYGWGAPLVVTIIAIVIDDNRDELRKYNIIPPKFDLNFKDGSAKYYLYIPVGVLILVNVILFAITIYNMILEKKGVDILSKNKDSAKNNENRWWLYIYIKVSMVMGISWLTELGLVLYPGVLPEWAYIIINSYNALIGPIIFVMFVLKRDVLKLLCKRFNYRCSFLDDKTTSVTKGSVNNGSTHRSRTSVSDSQSDIDMYNVKVNTNPNP